VRLWLCVGVGVGGEVEVWQGLGVVSHRAQHFSPVH
jgi:hypothetical protein